CNPGLVKRLTVTQLWQLTISTGGSQNVYSFDVNRAGEPCLFYHCSDQTIQDRWPSSWDYWDYHVWDLDLHLGLDECKLTKHQKCDVGLDRVDCLLPHYPVRFWSQHDSLRVPARR